METPPRLGDIVGSLYRPKVGMSEGVCPKRGENDPSTGLAEGPTSLENGPEGILSIVESDLCPLLPGIDIERGRLGSGDGRGGSTAVEPPTTEEGEGIGVDNGKGARGIKRAREERCDSLTSMRSSPSSLRPDQYSPCPAR